MNPTLLKTGDILHCTGHRLISKLIKYKYKKYLNLFVIYNGYITETKKQIAIMSCAIGYVTNENDVSSNKQSADNSHLFIENK